MGRLASAAALADVRIVLAHRLVLQHLQLRVQSANAPRAHKRTDINIALGAKRSIAIAPPPPPILSAIVRCLCVTIIAPESIRERFHLFGNFASFRTDGFFLPNKL